MQRSAVPVEGVEFTDKYGETRRIHHNQGPDSRLRVQRTSVTPALAMNPIVARLVGARIREHRLLRGWTMFELADRAGLRGGKQAIHALETAGRKEGMRFGTLYALAGAFGMPVEALLPSRERVMVEAKVGDSAEAPRLVVL